MTKRSESRFAPRVEGRERIVIRCDHPAWQTQTRAEVLNEPLILIAGLAAKAMVDMGDGKGKRDFFAQKQEKSEQSDRVATARDSGQDSVAGGRHSVRTHRPPNDV